MPTTNIYIYKNIIELAFIIFQVKNKITLVDNNNIVFYP